MRHEAANGCPCTGTYHHARGSTQEADHAADQGADPGTTSGAHVTGFLDMNLAFAVAANDSGIIIVEFAAPLGFLHSRQYLFGGTFVDKACHKHPDTCDSFC
jgi:hypothetical protein